jgi:thiol:disulfide interchange protein
MKAISYLAAFSLSAFAVVTSGCAETPKGWETEVEVALEIAKKENKAVMLEFTGSDWCPPCKMMKKKVFSKEDFVSKASEKFVLVELDFPKGDEALAEKNRPYQEKYEVEGYPTIVLLDSEGKVFGKFIASQYADVDSFLAKLEEMLGWKDLD